MLYYYCKVVLVLHSPKTNGDIIMNDTTFEGSNPHFNLSQPIRNIISEKGSTYLIRTAGSFLTINGTKVADPIITQSILEEREWRERTDEVVAMGAAFGTCRYFSALVPSGVSAFQGAVNLDEFVKICHENGLDMSVSVNPKPEFGGTAAHQTEIVSASVPVQQVSEIWIIVGNLSNPSEEFVLDDGVVYTWHPGRVYPRTDTVVKLIE